jgi:hypothetical protein
MYCGVGASAPSGCPAGTYMQGGVCVTCPIGSYCNSLSPLPVPCGAGTYGAATGGQDGTACAPCPAGSFCNTTGLSAGFLCAAGFYSAAPGLQQFTQKPAHLCPPLVPPNLGYRCDGLSAVPRRLLLHGGQRRHHYPHRVHLRDVEWGPWRVGPDSLRSLPLRLLLRRGLRQPREELLVPRRRLLRLRRP